MRTSSVLGLVLITSMLVAPLGGCSTAPKVGNRAEFLDRASSSRSWFERSVYGLRDQIQDSAGYVIFPNVTQYGILFGGGTMGRGALYRPDGSQVGWAAINTGSIGLQAGVQGFRMIMVLEDEAVVRKFMANQLGGQVSGVVVFGAGGSAKAPFRRGVACYQGANKGLMAGMNIGLDYIRYKPLDSG